MTVERKLWRVCALGVLVMQFCSSIIVSMLPELQSRLVTGVALSVVCMLVTAWLSRMYFCNPLEASAMFAMSNANGKLQIVGEPPTTTITEFKIIISAILECVKKPEEEFKMLLQPSPEDVDKCVSIRNSPKVQFNPLVPAGLIENGDRPRETEKAAPAGTPACFKSMSDNNVFQNIVTGHRNKRLKTGWNVVRDFFLNDWQTEPMIFVAFRMEYSSAASKSCCTDIARIHATIFEKIKAASAKYNTFWEWSGNSECVVYWPKTLSICVGDVLDVTITLRNLEVRHVSSFKWSVAITEGEARCGKIKSLNILYDVVFSEARDRALAMAQFGLSVQSKILCEETVQLDTGDVQSQYVKMPCWSVSLRSTTSAKKPQEQCRSGSVASKNSRMSFETSSTTVSPRHSRRRNDFDDDEDEKVISYCQLRCSRISGYSAIWKTIGEQDWKQAACDLASLVKRNKEDKHLRNIYNHVSGVWKRSRLFSLSFDRQLVNIKRPTETGLEATLDFQPAILSPVEDNNNNEQSMMTSVEIEVQLTEHQLASELAIFADLFTYHMQRKHVGSMTIGRTVYENCFSAENAVTWMCERFEITISEAVQLGELLRIRGIISHPKRTDHTFKLGKIVFKFKDDSPCMCPEDVSWDKARISQLLSSALYFEEREQESCDLSGVVFRNEKK